MMRHVIKLNLVIYKIFASQKIQSYCHSLDLEQKEHNPQTQKRCQIDRDTKPIKVKHWTPQKIIYKQVEIAFYTRGGLFSPPPPGFKGLSYEKGPCLEGLKFVHTQDKSFKSNVFRYIFLTEKYFALVMLLYSWNMKEKVGKNLANRTQVQSKICLQ